nr:putative ribonuclease h protein [Quercus suber]
MFWAKYFQSGNIFDAKESTTCSFSWRSILQTRERVLKGARWRVGDGTNISIWQHYWLPTAGGGRVLTPQRDPSLQMVSNLFWPGSRRWDEEFIDLNFYHWEAEVIKCIPVSQFVNLDTLVWPFSFDGVYSVRSAYRLLVELNRKHLPNPSAIELGKGLWKGIWRLGVPQKIKHFLWRAVREALPTKINLCKRQVVVDGMCKQCRDSAEDSIHALWFCDSAKSIWLSNLNEGLVTPNMPQDSPRWETRAHLRQMNI